MPGSPVRHARLKRLEALTSVENEAQTIAALCERIAGGYVDEEGRVVSPQTLPEVCRALDVPYGRLMQWIDASESRAKAVATAYEYRARALADEAIEIADAASGAETAVQLGAAKLQVETRFKVGKHHAPRMYGEQEVQKQLPQIVIQVADLRGGGEVEIKGRVVEQDEPPLLAEQVQHEEIPSEVSESMPA